MTSHALKLAAMIGGGYLAVRILTRRSYDFAGKVVVITGGVRGLGLELARRFAVEGASLAICARTAEDVALATQELQSEGTDVLGLICDVTVPEDVGRFVEEVVARWGRIDVLVNNAGIIQVGPFNSMTDDDFQQALAVHLWGPLNMTRAALPAIRAAGEGRIVNIASIGGKLSVPHLLPYCASKFALEGLSQGLRWELAGENIWVTTVSPGMMRTGSPRNALFKGDHRAEYAWFSIGGSLPVLTISSAAAARRIVEACRRGDAELTFPLPVRLATGLHALFPELTDTAFRLAQRILPTGNGDTRSFRGDESQSTWSPSWLTMLNEQAALRNNEIHNVST